MVEFPYATVTYFLKEAVADLTWVQSTLATTCANWFIYLTRGVIQYQFNKWPMHFGLKKVL